ncbi:MAG: SPO1 DNA polymerase [Gammaproteobacteria bacterium]|nr:SPO1 DNA polymerase [Gammaproteobacteria bacterium]
MRAFDPDCQRCSRISAYLLEVRTRYPDYHARPVPAFGAGKPQLLIVGLAPGLHGANATGRPFTGDFAGILLYQTLYRYGFSNQATATDAADGLRLHNCRITNAVKCLPPDNKPTGEEINNCNDYLRAELNGFGAGLIILALGRIAHNAVLKALGSRQADYPFAHGHSHQLDNRCWLVDSYHCSRYNTQTRRLTEKMFHEVFDTILELQAKTGN